ncbi:MAG: glycosyltransferase family 4 protein [Firmicutes bacterium]|nr:glycosyltransferase family 4 protein [Bacillota bacterium]
MKILFDNRMKNWSGIGRYSFNLIKEFSCLMKNKNDVVLLSNTAYNSNDFNIMNCRAKVFSLKEQVELPLLNKKNKIDLYHSPHFVFPVLNSKKMVLTIHDLTPLLFPQYFSVNARIYMKMMIWLSRYRTAKIITVSKNTKEDLIDKFSFRDDKIEVIYNGVGECYKSINNQELLDGVKKKYDTGENFILYVGNIKQHKNIVRLLKAVSRLDRPNKLIIVGKRDNAYDEVLTVIEKEGLNDRVIFTGFVSDKDLVYLYNAAKVFIYPSLYEGFGLPPLEAMACGTPVITSNVSSLPEVVADAAIKINPYSIDDIDNAIHRVLTDPDLQKKLSEKGKERAKKFTWKKTAEETLKVYQDVMQGEGS